MTTSKYTRDQLEQMRVFQSIIEQYLSHDDTCESLSYAWLGRDGGVSDLVSQSICDTCDMYFYNEGLVWVNFDQDDEMRLCACCARSRGHRISVSRHGWVSLAE